MKSVKKGWAGGDSDLHKEFGAHWYYNWTLNIEDSRPEFVPMLKGNWNINDNDYGKIKGYRRLKAMLGFNEPERADQGNVTVDAAIDYSPKHSKLAGKEKIALDSPSPHPTKRGLDCFMNS